MNDANQTYVPESFFALYQDSRGRLTASKALIAERHELCEDMASALAASCMSLHVDGSSEEQAALAHCNQALMATPTLLDPPQAQWVVTRTAELLGWAWEPPPRA